MNTIQYRISLDCTKSSAQYRVNAKKGESESREIIATFNYGGSKFELGDNITAVLRARKADGTVLFNNCEVDGNTVKYKFTSQTVAAAGTAECEIQLIGAGGKVLFSPKFELYVEDNLYDDNEIESQNEFTELVTALAEIEGLHEEVSQALEDAQAAQSAAEAAQTAAESAAAAAEGSISAAQSAAQTAAAAAQSAAQSAGAAQTAKTAAETAAQGAAADKTATQTAKTAAEAAQSAAETAKASAETAAQGAAADKTAAQTAKTAAEAAQSAAQTAAQGAATAKTAAETAKTAAETAKASAESAKTAAETAAQGAAADKTAAQTAKTAAEAAQAAAEASAEDAARLAESFDTEAIREEIEAVTHPYISLERLDTYLFKASFDTIPEDDTGDNDTIPGGCSSYVKDGKLFRNLDWDFSELAAFHVICPGFEGMAFSLGLNSTELDDALIAKLPQRIMDGKNDNGIMVSTHVLYNDWEWSGDGETPLYQLPSYILQNVKSMATLQADLGNILSDLCTYQTLDNAGYLLQFLVTDGTTTYAILPPESSSGAYVLQDISSNPKLSNFRWVSSATVARASLQDRPMGVERWNMMPCKLSELRFTKAYETPERLSEFIGLQDTDKDSTDSELTEIYNAAHALYLQRTRDGQTWQTFYSVVYSARGMESLYIQENWERDFSGFTDRDRILELLSEAGFDIEYDEEGNKYYLLGHDGTRKGEGVDAKGGVGFDAISIEKNEEDGKYYLHITLENEDVVIPAELPEGIGGGGGAGSIIRITSSTASNITFIATDDEMPIQYSWSSVDADDNTPTGSGTETWIINGVRAATRTVQQGSNSFDIKPYAVAGAENNIILKIEDQYGNSKIRTWKATVLQYEIRWTLASIQKFTGTTAIRVNATGAGEKTVTVKIDGVTAYTGTVTADTGSITANIPAQEHGAHVISAEMTADIEGEDPIEAQSLRSVGVWVDPDETTPIIAVLSNTVTQKQYEIGNIQWMVIDPTTEAPTVELYEDDVLTATVHPTQTIQTWNYRSGELGNHLLAISCGDEQEQIIVTITDLGVNIEPVTAGLVMDINPSGHNNLEEARDEFGYTDSNGDNQPFDFSENFDWNSGGFQTDADGTAFVIPKGCYVDVDFYPWADNAKLTGKEMKFMFKVKNVADPDAVILHTGENDLGIQLKATSAILSSQTASREVPYTTDKLIEMDILIDAQGSEYGNLATIWLNSIPSRGFYYTNTDSWTQNTPKNIRIGSANCDVWLYRAKAYNVGLSWYEILCNFIADCLNPDEMIRRAERNDIFNTDMSINLQKLAQKNTELRVLKASCSAIPVTKGDKHLSRLTQIYTAGGPADNFTAENEMNAQGTSALEYADAALNFDFDFASSKIAEAGLTPGFIGSDGETAESYAMSENAEPVQYLNLKANTASSDNANNRCGVEWYNRFDPCLKRFKNSGLYPANLRDSCEGYPAVLFLENTGTAPMAAGARTVQPGQTMLYAVGDLLNSKKNFAVFGQDNTTWPLQCCVEITNNNGANARFAEDLSEDEAFDDTGDFDTRFPKNGLTAEMKAAFHAMHSWVVSTRVSDATNESLEEAVTYAGTTYVRDTPAYRAAKFKAELADYFSVDSLLFHYIYTDRNLCIDNRAKNVFFSYEYDPDAEGYRWNVRCAYDQDTLGGNDNSGGMTFTYGLTDEDMVGNSMVYNAADSTLWSNIRDYMWDELCAEYRELESDGAWSAEGMCNAWSTYQSARPEALVILDMYGKYISNGQTRFINMMYGDKRDQFRYFQTNQEWFTASRYGGTKASGNAIHFRSNTFVGAAVPSSSLVSIVPAQDCYLAVKYGEVATVKKRCYKGVAETFSLDEVGKGNTVMNDMETYIYPAYCVAELGDVSALYSKLFDVTKALRNRKLQLGSRVTGYSNTGVNSENGGVDIGNNTVIEFMDISGFSNYSADIDMTAQHGLKKFYAANSAILGVGFAEGAPLQEAVIPAVKSLRIKKLHDLQMFTCDTSQLETLLIEDTPFIDSAAMVLAAGNLQKGRLTGVNWILDTEAAIMKCIGLSGISSAGGDTANFVLTGEAYIAETTQSMLSIMQAAFPELDITVGTVLPTYTVEFYDGDDNLINTQTVPQGRAATDPVQAGIVAAPTKAPTLTSTWEFMYWDTNFNNVQADLEVRPVFSRLERIYTVNWHDANGNVIATRTTTYTGNLTFPGLDLPDKPNGVLWIGWDTETTNIQADLEVYPIYLEPRLPAVKPSGYTHLYSDDPNDISAYSKEELYGIAYNHKADIYFDFGDKIKIAMTAQTASVIADEEIEFTYELRNHFMRADGTEFANVFFGMTNCLKANRSMRGTSNNEGGYPETTMCSWLNNTLYPVLPQWLRRVIAEVLVRSTAGHQSTEIVTTPCKLFLRSVVEVGLSSGGATDGYAGEVDPNAEAKTSSIYTNNTSRLKKLYGGTSNTYWWLRSPYLTSDTSFAIVNNGGILTNTSATNSYGVSFGFCM